MSDPHEVEDVILDLRKKELEDSAFLSVANIAAMKYNATLHLFGPYVNVTRKVARKILKDDKIENFYVTSRIERTGDPETDVKLVLAILNGDESSAIVTDMISEDTIKRIEFL